MKQQPQRYSGSIRSYRELLSDRLHLAAGALLVVTGLGLSSGASAVTALSDAPVFSTRAVLSNVALALSVEWPTASRVAHTGAYSSATVFRGYFDPEKCYLYQYDAVEANRHFYPAAMAVARTCAGVNHWSGNYLNWAATQTIDPFRWAMTGGYRVVDTTTTTILQKAWHSGQGNLYPNKALPGGEVAGATPFTWGNFKTRINGAGFQMLFTGSATDTATGVLGNINAGPPASVPYNPAAAVDPNLVYAVSIRVKVCDAGVGLESNCVRYGANYKPEGLMQQYSQKLRFSAFGYLNQSGNDRDGAVMRARMKFVGPTYPRPGLPDAVNPQAEWSPTTGVFLTNPDAADATATNAAYGPTPAVNNSGVANYLNKFGQLLPGNYKSNDPVSELYYATQRYFRNLGSVPEWNTLTGTTTASQALDGFPVVRTWDDPIQYSCQKNFVLGIGDIYTHADKNIPGTTGATLEPPKPGSVTSDNAVNAQSATNLAFALQGLGAPNADNYSGRNNSAGMVGLAYWANVNDIRPDLPDTYGKQTIKTLWVDVLEQPFVANNQFYLTAKYGGFIAPDNYDFANTTALPQAWWATSPDTLTAGAVTQPRPDNYFTAGNPDQMISGLTKAFIRIDDLGKAFTTSFSTSLPQVSQLGNASFGAQYNANNWTGEIVASQLDFDLNGEPTLVERWKASATLATQLGGTGWNTARRVATWNGAAGVPFRHASLTAAQRTALDTPYRAGDDSADFVNYLRGARTYEGTTPTTSYRVRDQLLGDIVGSRTRPVGPPALPLSDSTNPGYGTFKTTYALRPTVVYVGANDGMVHAFNGALTGPGAGAEIFAYVPSATFSGPSVPATPAVNGLASLGNPNFVHHFFVNATPSNQDVDFTRTWNGTAIGTGAPDWRSILVGGLGKGGRSYYALDITNPAGITTEADAVSRVLWEFTAPQMGFTFGEPAIVKTRKYGWTVIIPSGYNTPDGQGYLFFVNPRTGQLLEPPVPTGAGSVANDAGLAHINAYVLDFTDGYADAVYGGDLLGNLWRFDLTGTTGAYPAPQLLATLTDSLGNPQPVTSRPVVELHPKTRERVVLVGTGRLLDSTDISSTQEQTFYAIKDGNQVRFNRAAELPTGITFPITRGQLVLDNDLLLGFTATAAAPMGWYTDLGRGAANVGWRVVSDPTTFQGIVAFAPTLPSVADACSPSGESRVYAVDFASGVSRIVDVSGAVLPFTTAGQGVVTDLRFLSVGGRARLIAGTDRGSVVQIRGEFGSNLGLRRFNWREVEIGN